MWRDIEEHIDTYRDELDMDVPGSEIWEGIEVNLEDQPKRSQPIHEHWFSRQPYWKVAAIVLMTVGISYFSFSPDSGVVTSETQEISSLAPTQEEENMPPLPNAELAELESYYLGRFNARWEELGQYDLRQFQFTGQFMEELEELDDNYLELRQEIVEEGYHEQMIEGLIRTHELKIRILESLLAQIRKDQEQADDYEDAENLAIPL